MAQTRSDVDSPTKEYRTKIYDDLQTYFIALFTKARDEKNYVLINDNFIITIENITVEPSGCFQCRAQYNSIELSGLIYTPEEEDFAYRYFASVSSYYIMCNCEYMWRGRNRRDEEDLELLFKGTIERDDKYICHYFINKNTVKIL